MNAGAIPRDANVIAVVAPSWVGDLVMATPVFRAIHEHRGSATRLAVVRPGQDELLDGCPWFNDVLVARAKGLTGPWRTGRAMRRHDVDVVLLLPNSPRAALGARCSGASHRIGYARNGRGVLLTHAIDSPKRVAPHPTLDDYADLACAALGVDDIDRHVELFVSEAQHDAALAMLDDLSGRRIVLLNPGANRADKRWPAANFAAVADALRDSSTVVAITGAPSERDVIDAVITSSAGEIIDLTSRGMTLGTLKAIMPHVHLLITNDTGPRHLAAAFSTPMIALFGPTDHRWTVLPGVEEHRLLAEPFLPETLVADHHPRSCAIARIPVRDVVWAARRCLAGRPSPSAVAP